MYVIVMFTFVCDFSLLLCSYVIVQLYIRSINTQYSVACVVSDISIGE